MLLNRLTSVAALSLALLLLSGGIAEAGYVCTGMGLADDSTFATETASGGASLNCRSASSRKRLVIDVDSNSERPVGSFAPGGMTSPTEAGSSPTSTSVVLPPSGRPLVTGMVSWVGADGRSALPPPLSTGIFRPPRSR